MIQPSCVFWGQFGCHYFNTPDYDWEDGTTIYLVHEKDTDEEHTTREFTDVYYYICKEDYDRLVEVAPDFFDYAEKIEYKKGMDLDKNPKFASTAKRFVQLREEKKVIEDNLKIFRFHKDKLLEEKKMLESISDEDLARLTREFNDSPLRDVNPAPQMNKEKRIHLIDTILKEIA